DGFLVGGAHQGAGALRGERADDDGLGLVGALGGGALVVGHGERFHGRRAGVAGGGRAGGVGGGHLDGAEELGGRVRGVHADAVFGDVPAQRGGQPVGAGVGAQLLGHRGDGVGAVVVAGAAAEGQAAGQRQRAARVVDGQAEGLGAHLHRDREAGVQVDVGDVVDANARGGQRLLARGGDGRGGGHVGAVGDVP